MTHPSGKAAGAKGQCACIADSVSAGEEVSFGRCVVVESGVCIGARTRIGHHAVIARNAHIGEGCEIGAHVVIHEGVRIGNGVRIDDGAVIGKQPMTAPNSAVTRKRKQPPCRIGSGCLIGAGAVIYAGCVLEEHILVADLATIREEVTVGNHTIVGRGVAIENECAIGRYCKIETNAYIAAYSVVEDRAFIAPGVLTSNDNFLGRTKERFRHFKGAVIRRGARLGTGSVILPGMEIEGDAVVAAGALLTKNAAARTIYAGVPARTHRTVPKEQLLENQGWDDV